MVTQTDEIFKAMQEGVPLKTYVKTILGKVHIVRLNPFSEQPEGVILDGVPGVAKDFPNTIVELWTHKQTIFFEKTNRSHIEDGRLAVIAQSRIEETPKSPNEVTDEEVDKLLNGKYLALKNKLDKFTNQAPVFRILNRAREINASEKYIAHIEKKLAELQLQEFQPPEV
jgi:hypothetical protein